MWKWKKMQQPRQKNFGVGEERKARERREIKKGKERTGGEKRTAGDTRGEDRCRRGWKTRERNSEILAGKAGKVRMLSGKI